MLIQDLMRPTVVTIDPEASMEEAYHLLMKHDIHHLVVMEGTQVKGVIASSDVASLHRQELASYQAMHESASGLRASRNDVKACG